VHDLAPPADSFFICYNKRYVRDPASLPSGDGFVLTPRVQSFDKNGRAIPFNIDELVNYIVYLQFSAEHARAALEFMGYDVKSAITLLVDGEIRRPREEGAPALPPRRRQEPIAEPEPEPEPMKLPTRRTDEERKLSATMKTLSDEQRLVVNRLASKYDLPTVLQVFLACDKNEEITRQCLETM
jgi:hypothetical protein